MVTLSIGSVDVPLEQVSEGWINQQLGRRRADGSSVCVRVNVQTDDARLILTTPDCSSSIGGARRPNRLEERIFQLWKERGLNRSDFEGGQVVAFLHQLRQMI